MENPLISVIVPCYNVEKYVTECLESIVNQSYQNLEIIIVNDGATDNTEQKILPFLEDKRVRYIMQKNQGQAAARNTGLDNMNGDFVCFIDADDYVDLDFIKKLYENLVENNADISICDFHWFDDGVDFTLEKREKKNVCYTRDEIMQEMLKNWKLGIVCSRLYKAELFSELRFATGRVYEDEAIAHHILWRSRKITEFNEQLYFYRRVQGSTMNSNYTEKKIKNEITAFDDRIKFFEKNNIPNVEQIYIKKWYSIIVKKGITQYDLKYAKKYLLTHPLEFFTHFKGSKKEKIKFYFQMLKEIIKK